MRHLRCHDCHGGSGHAPESGRSGSGATISEALATGLLARLFGTKVAPPARGPHTPVERPVVDAFVCTTCGRTDLPEAGGWDPPICLECDAAINFDADVEHAWNDEGHDR